jgi:hypothetical protein
MQHKKSRLPLMICDLISSRVAGKAAIAGELRVRRHGSITVIDFSS